MKPCKDCVSEGLPLTRPANYPGPRCYTHTRLLKSKRRKEAHERHVQKTYGLEPGEYLRLYKLQGGVCYICQRAKGQRKRLAVDHDHRTGKVRGLLCTKCNHDVLGMLGEDPNTYLRIIEYLRNPPANRLREVS